MDLLPEQLVSLISSPAMLVDRASVVVSANRAMCVLLGLQHEQLVGKNATHILASADRKKALTYVSSFPTYATRSNSVPETLDVEIAAQSRVASLSPLFAKSGSLRGFLLQVNGAILAAENELWQSALTIGRLGVWERRVSDEEEFPADSWWPAWKYRSGDRPHLRSRVEWLSKIHPEDRHLFEGVSPVWRGVDGDTYEVRYRERNRLGEYIWILSQARIAKRNSDGQPEHIVGVDSNITDIVAAEQSRLELAEKLSHGERLKSIGQLTGGIAHDFNNLLAIISGSSELLTYKYGRENIQLKNIRSAVRRGSQLTNSLLAFSRKQPLRPGTVDVSGLLRELSLVLGRTIPEHIKLEVSIKDGIWSCVVDRSQIENAIINLAVNARDAMSSGGRLSIVAENVTSGSEASTYEVGLQPGEYVMFTIADTGSGMSPEVCERVFEPFFTTKSVGQGSGLGLSMVFGFARQSDGHVSMESELGKGSVVRLYLPRALEVPTDESSDQPVTPSDREPARIMVVEDNDAIRAINTDFLEGIGYEVLNFQTADDAFTSFLEDEEIDLLLTDLMLPGQLDGVTLGVELRQRKPSLQILYMSGYQCPEQLDPESNSQGVGYLQKPFELRDLSAKITSALASRSSLHQCRAKDEAR